MVDQSRRRGRPRDRKERASVKIGLSVTPTQAKQLDAIGARSRAEAVRVLIDSVYKYCGEPPALSDGAEWVAL